MRRDGAAPLVPPPIAKTKTQNRRQKETQMLRNTIRTAAIAAVVAFAALPAAAQNWKPLDGDPKVLNFGIISTESTQNLKSQWVPLIDAMKAQTGMEVKPFFAPDYAGVIEGMRFGKVQVAWHGNKSAIEAVDRAGGEVFAQFIDLEGRPGYYSYVIAHRDSPLKSIDEMIANGKNLSFGMGDPQSTSGTLVC